VKYEEDGSRPPKCFVVSKSDHENNGRGKREKDIYVCMY
ncbi:MAG: hypothetical protein ACI90V_012807, partial [Bacillariaceae sp.]|jgi:hypothetical protein